MQVYLWGLNNKHQIRPNGKKRIKIPQKISMPINIKQVCFSKLFMMALATNGDVFEYRSINNINRIPQLRSVSKLAAGDYHFAAVNRNKQLFTWADENSQFLQVSSLHQQNVPIKVLEDIVNVFCGPSCTFVLNDSNELYACGNNANGQLGVGSNQQNVELSKVAINAIVTKVSSDQYHSLFLTSQKEVFVSGNNKSGCLGLQSTGQKINIPIQLLLKQKTIAISCGGYSAAVSQKGSIYVWGFCPFGFINRPTIIDKINKKFIDVKLSNSNAYAKSEDGQLWVWGNNRYGQLGVGDIDERVKPFPVILLDQKYVQEVFVGPDSALCLVEDRVYHQNHFKRHCCQKKKIEEQRDRNSKLYGSNQLSSSAGRSNHSKSRREKCSKKKSKQLKSKEKFQMTGELKQFSKQRQFNKSGRCNQFLQNRCPIKVIDDESEDVVHAEFEGTYSSIPQFQSTISNRNRSLQKVRNDYDQKLQQVIQQNKELRNIIIQKDQIIEDITLKIQALEEAIDERDSRDQLTLREHFAKEVQKMENKYIGQISKLSGVISSFAMKYNTQTTNPYETLAQRDSNVNTINRESNIVMNITTKCKSKHINTEESLARGESMLKKTVKSGAEDKNTQIFNNQDKQNITIHHNIGKEGKEEELKSKIKQLERRVESMNQSFECELMNGNRQMDMYKHKVKQLIKVIAQKDQIISQLKNQSNAEEDISPKLPKPENTRKNIHISRVIESIQKNKRRISVSADKLMNILEQ